MTLQKGNCAVAIRDSTVIENPNINETLIIHENEALGVDDMTTNELNIYPTPANNRINLQTTMRL